MKLTDKHKNKKIRTNKTYTKSWYAKHSMQRHDNKNPTKNHRLKSLT